MSDPHLIDQRILSTSSSIEDSDGGVADVGVDLHEEVAADDHRLAFGMIDVRGNDRAAASDFVAYEFRSDVFRDRSAK